MLVLRPGALGDTLLAVPALRALKAAGFAPVTLAAHAGAARLLARVGEVERGIAFDEPSMAKIFQAEDLGEPCIAWMRPRDAPALRNALVVAPGRPSAEQHCAGYLVSTLAPLGVDTSVVDDQPLHVAPIGTDEVLVHPGSGSAHKNWPPSRFAEVIRALERPVRLIVGEADTDVAREVEAHLGHSLPRLTHGPLEELAGRLAGCSAYLGNDSGVSHLAGLCGARTITLFGPTSPTVWRPLGPDVHVEWFDARTDRVVARLENA